MAKVDDRERQIIEAIKDSNVSHATIFLFGDKEWMEQGKQYDVLVKQIGKQLISAGYSKKEKIVAAVVAYIDPTIIDKKFKDARRVAVLYSHGRSGVYHDEERLKKIGIKQPVLVTIGYSCFNNPEYWGLRDDLSAKSWFEDPYFNIGNLVTQAEGFAALGLDFLLTKKRAGIEDGRISASEGIQKQMLAAGVGKENLEYVIVG